MTAEQRPPSCFEVALAFVLVCLGLALLVATVRAVF